MKNLFILALSVFLSSLTVAQESLISDIMQVEAKPVNNGVDVDETKADYQKKFDDEKAKLDKTLEGLNEEYKKSITSLIEGFTKVQEGGIEQEIRNEKGKVVTNANSETVQLKNKKRNAVVQFKNAMSPLILKFAYHLKDLKKEKKEEIAQLEADMYAQFEEEYKANRSVISQFKATNHIAESESVEAAPSEME